MKAYNLPDTTTCLNCLKKLDGATGTSGDRGPRVGDISICIYCASVGTYTKELSLKPISCEALNEIKLESEDTFNEIAKCVAMIHLSNNHKNSKDA